MHEQGFSPPIAPAVQPGAYGGGAFVNTSGQGASAVVPQEVLTGFNWGACLLNWIWGIGNSVWIALAMFVVGIIPFGGIALAIYLGLKGNELAWRNRRFESVEQFHAVQNAWKKWGIILFVASIVLSALTLPAALQSGAVKYNYSVGTSSGGND
jgi:hypothetical protein